MCKNIINRRTVTANAQFLSPTPAAAQGRLIIGFTPDIMIVREICYQTADNDPIGGEIYRIRSNITKWNEFLGTFRTEHFISNNVDPAVLTGQTTITTPQTTFQVNEQYINQSDTNFEILNSLEAPTGSLSGYLSITLEFIQYEK